MEPEDSDKTIASGKDAQTGSAPGRGCLRVFVWGLVVLAVILVAAAFWIDSHFGTLDVDEIVRLKVVQTLEAKLGRKVTVGSVRIATSQPRRVVIDDLKIANAAGGLSPYFATVQQVVIRGDVESLWTRSIRIDRVDVVNPHLFFEISPTGSRESTNVPHWNNGPAGGPQIVHVTIGNADVTGGVIDFTDRRHDLSAVVSNLASQISISLIGGVYQGVLTSPSLRLRIQDYVPLDLDLRGGFKFANNGLELRSIAMRGRDAGIFVSGNIAPLTDGVYDLHVTSQIGLARVREMFRVQKRLEGNVSIDGRLRGRQGDFTLTGKWISPRLLADAYELTAARGAMSITGDRAVVDVESARYAGGTIGAHYTLPKFAEPYPMAVELRYDHIAMEGLFNDWGIADTGLRGAATGKLSYHWEKDRVLEGAGNGTATLSRNAVAFSHAPYPIPLSGKSDFALNNGVVTFKSAELNTQASKIAFDGTLRISDVFTNLRLAIDSTDFADLDRIGLNFAHSAGKKSYTLLGLGGSGRITGTVQGTLKSPRVAAQIAGQATKYNNVLLGDSDLALAYDGAKSVMTFQHALFRDGDGTLSLAGTVAFPDRGPSPEFDITIDASGYPVERAMETVNLKLAVAGLGTGRVLVRGTPNAGTATFAGLNIVQKASSLTLNGETQWAPGKGSVNLDLDIDASSYPVADIVKFLDLGTFPVTGDLTGKLHLKGPKNAIEGAGAIAVRNGSIYGEPVDSLTTDLSFANGAVRATGLTLVSPAGTITGQAQLNLTTNQFDYTINQSTIDLSKVKLLSSLAGALGGKVTIDSTGAGSLAQPELVVNVTLNDATLHGLSLPPGTPPPTLYLAIRNGRLIVRGSAADVLTIEGDGTVAPDGTLDGLVHVVVSDIAKMLSLSPNTATLPASGNLAVDLKLGGKMASLESLQIEATVTQFDVKVADHEFTAVQPPRFSIREGRVVVDSFELRREDSSLSVSGFAELTGAKRLNIDVKGAIEAALLQLFTSQVKADGHITVAGSVQGTLADPRITGTAEFENAQVRFAGFPQLIDHLTGTLVFKGDRVDIDSLRANVGGGTIVAGGFITTEGLTPKRARVTLQGTGVSVRYFEGVSVEGDFNLLLAGDMDRFSLQGDVNVSRALYFKDFDFQQSLLNLVLSRRGVTPVVAASWQDRVSLRMHLSAPGTLAVRNNIADATGTAEIDLNGTLANPVILGDVSLDEGGRVRFQKIDYRVARGSITFQNPFRIDPYFDITLEGRVSGGFAEVEDSGPVEVTVNLTGTLDRISPTITSDPPASDITLFSLLGLGNIANSSSSRSTGTNTNADAALYGRSLLYQSLGSLIGSKILPFADTFTFDPGYLDASSDPGPKVTFEKRVANDVRVVVVYNLRDQKNRELIEWEVNPEWTMQFTRDETRSEYRLEGRFHRRYTGHWSWGTHGRNALATFASLKPGSFSSGVQPVSLPPATRSDEEPVDGRSITSIDYRADGHFDTTMLSQFVSLKVGDPLTIRSLQSVIKSLFATGDFRDIHIDSADSGTGVALTIALYLNYRVGRITIDGLVGGERDRASREITVHTGDVLSLSAVDRSAVALQTALNHGGYLESSVDPETTFLRELSRADVIFHVTPGPHAVVSTVVIDGDTSPFTTSELIAQMKRGPGKPFAAADARLDEERIRRYLIRRDYRKADVRFLRSDYDARSGSVTLQYRVITGPIVHVAVTGVSTREVRGLLPFRKNQAYSEDAVDRAASDIVQALQQRGFFNAIVDTESTVAKNVWTTTFHVTKGEPFVLTAVTFSGNQKVTDKQLAAVVSTSPSGGIKKLLATVLRRPSGVTKAALSSDRDAVEGYYRLQGFPDVKIATPVVSLKNGAMTVDFPIVEGPQTIVQDVRIEGNAQVHPEDLPKMQLKSGSPLNPQVERSDLVALQTFYAQRGNAEAQVTPREEVDADKSTAKMTYVIAEGPKISVDDVIVRGNTYTSSKVVLRTSGLHKGDPFSYTSILEAQRNLYRLGTFQRVDVQPEQVGTSLATRDVVVQVEEGKDLTVAGSVGVAADSTGSGNKVTPLGSLSVAHRNLFGTGRYAGIQLVASTERREVFLTYREPFIFNRDIPVQLSVFQSDDIRRGAQIRQRGTFIEASKIAGLQARWSLRYEYKISECLSGDICAEAASAIVPGLDRTLLNIKISSITPTFFWDRRDDAVDPHRGFFTTASVEYAFRAFAADAHFMKEFVQGSFYLPVGGRSVIAISGRLGLIQRLGTVSCATADDPGRRCATPVPLSERFTGGGDTSHRAFALDLLGTLCEGKYDTPGCKPTLIRPDANSSVILPIGGNSLVLLNAEYRFPIFSALGGTLFSDIGNVYADSAFHAQDLRYGVGTGVRYLSAVGPIRFDIGYKINRRSYEKPFAYFITLGYAF